MKTIAFANQKGGVGKTTSVINCRVALARQNKQEANQRIFSQWRENEK